MGIIDTRVCIDDMFGPFDCKLDPSNRWNGWLSPHFTLGTVRKLSAQTLREADECGHDSVDTIHVIDGREDSTETVHVIEGGTYNGEPQAIAVRINWRNLARGKDGATTITRANAKDRKAARRTPGGRGARTSVVVHVRWMYLGEGSDTAVTIEAPGKDGLYAIGGWEWTWHFASWWCFCGNAQVWHELDCENCGLTRETRIGDPNPAKVTAHEIANILRPFAPEVTSALVDLTDGGHVFAVYAGDTEIDTGDDNGPFDTESLGAVDAAIREVTRYHGGCAELTSVWEHVPDADCDLVYRVTFPAPLQ
ncbi:hypothetical protein ACFWAP_33570 [Streptomyces goshikiensis]|uniref:hypothetical protein n=1 Tax=Streptomyces goshikiensis TaxID=1942 RepID=UPI00366346AF